MKQFLMVVAGAIAGGVLGFFAFRWALEQNLYGLVLPGGLLGLGAGIAKNRWLWLAIVCGIAALALGLFSEWNFFPFKADGSLSFFLLHAYQLHGWTLVMIALGGAIGFWVPFRRIEKDKSAAEKLLRLSDGTLLDVTLLA